MTDSDDPLVGFDQTNGVVSGADGESDGTVEGEDGSDADRDAAVHPKPVGAQDTFITDHYGEGYDADPNP